jgi:hypothetical protein
MDTYTLFKVVVLFYLSMIGLSIFIENFRAERTEFGRRRYIRLKRRCIKMNIARRAESKMRLFYDQQHPKRSLEPPCNPLLKDKEPRPTFEQWKNRYY